MTNRTRLFLLLAPVIIVVLLAAFYFPYARTQPIRIPYSRLPPPIYIPTREPNEVLPPEVQTLRRHIQALQQDFLNDLAADLFADSPFVLPPPNLPEPPARPPAVPPTDDEARP
jgi:hypothetical protein